jgi:hypothetical protein
LGTLKNRDNKICSWVPWDSNLRKAALASGYRTEMYCVSCEVRT